MHARSLKYISPLLVYALAVIALTQHGIYCWPAIIYAWIFIPVAELFIKPDASNMNAVEEELAKKDRVYDWMLYLAVILLYPTLILFLFSMKEESLSVADRIARIWTMGLLCGTFGINVGHELGHRANRFERLLAKASLLTSLYMHFFIEHNKGHHKNVGMEKDPGSARLGEPVYAFYVRTIIFSYIDAWRIANREIYKKNKHLISFSNEMIRMHVIQFAFVLIILLAFGWIITLYYLAAALVGILLLETVNYIEHYGLSRKKIAGGKYERAMPQHSWNSDHIIGRLMLFELSRHSDHHYLASRKYQILRHHEDAPQMPTGYPGMMILSLFPPAWFYVMHKRMKLYKLLLQEENSEPNYLVQVS
jgi:alkane 1-monooxygenase